MSGPNVPLNDRQVNKIEQTQSKVRPAKVASAKKRGDSILTGLGQDVGEYVLQEVAIPGIKNVILDIAGVVTDSIKEGLTKVLFGEAATTKHTRPGSSYTPYNRVARGVPTRPETAGGSRYHKPQGSRYGYEQIMFETVGEARQVLDTLCEVADKYGVATVGDYLALVGETSNPTHEYWGWYADAIRDSSIKRVRHGYIIVLEKPRDLKH